MVGNLCFPPIWSLIWRPTDPCRSSLHLGLDIRLVAVCKLDNVTWEAAIKVSNIRGLRCGRGTTHITTCGLIVVMIPRPTCPSTQPFLFMSYRQAPSRNSSRRKFHRDVPCAHRILPFSHPVLHPPNSAGCSHPTRSCCVGDSTPGPSPEPQRVLPRFQPSQ